MSVMATDEQRAAYIKQARASHDALPADVRAELDDRYRRVAAEAGQRRALANDPAWNDPDWTNR